MRKENKTYQKAFFADIITAIYSNAFAEQYNAAVDSILNDSETQSEFMTILDEQKAVCIDCGMTEREAESYVTQFDNLRRAAMCFIKSY